MKVAVGDWVIYDDSSGCGLSFAVAEVLYVDRWFAVARTGGMAFDVAKYICFVGNREQVLALKTKVDAMLKERLKAKQAAEGRVREIADQHALAIRKFMKKQT